MDRLTKTTWRAWRDARKLLWGSDTTLALQDTDGTEIVSLSDGWIGVDVVNEANGLPEFQFNILEQDSLTDAILEETRFFALDGVTYEKRTDAKRNPRPRFWNVRAQPVNTYV